MSAQGMLRSCPCELLMTLSFSVRNVVPRTCELNNNSSFCGSGIIRASSWSECHIQVFQELQILAACHKRTTYGVHL